MHVFFYIPVIDKRSEANRKIVENAAHAAHTEVFSSIEDLAGGLRRVLFGDTITVLYAPRVKDFQALFSIKELLQEVYVLLMLPDRKESTISKGHILRPRFLTFVDADLVNVGLVLTKMIETYGKNAGAEQ